MVVRSYSAYSLYLAARDLVNEAQGFQSYHINIWKLTSRREGTGMGRKRKWRRTGFRIMLDQYRVLQSVADEYDLKMLQAERENGVFKVNTSQGWKKFKPFKYSAVELEFVHGILEHLAAKGWKRSLPLHLTKEGATYVETPFAPFYVTIWVQGARINPEDPFQLEMSAKTVGEMHRLLKDYGSETECHRQSPPNWQEKYRRQAEDLARYQQQAESTRKSKFGRRFRQVADDFLRMMGIGLQLLEDADYGRVSEDEDLITVCHTSPIASNLIAGNDGKIYIIDFDNARMDLRIYDVARLLVRHGDWDIDKALFLLRSYQEANPLRREEIALLPALCAFPSRGWQVARSFYELDRVHLGRLETAIDEVTKQDVFVKALAQIQPADLVYSPEQIFQTIPYPEHLIAPVALKEIPMMVDDAPEEVDTADVTEPASVHGGEGWEQPFYWGDADASTDDFTDADLWAIRQQMASLAQRLDSMVDAVYGVGPSGEDEVEAEVRVSHVGLDQEDEMSNVEFAGGFEIPVETLQSQDVESPVVPAIASGGAYSLDMGEEMEVREALGYLGLHNEQEGEVRLDIAADMEDMSREIPAERSVFLGEEYHEVDVIMGEQVPVWAAHQGELGEMMDAGIEIPVEYAKGLEPVAEEVLAQEFTQPVPNYEIPSTEVAGPPVVATTDAAEFNPPITDDGLEPQVLAEVYAPDLVADHVDEAVGPILESSVEEVAQEVQSRSETADAAVEVSDHKYVHSQPEAKAAAPTVTATSRKQEPSSKPSTETVVQWGSFPEPLGGRRRSRERRSV